MDPENIMNGPRNHKQTFKAHTSDNEGTQTSDSGSPKKQKTWKNKKNHTINSNNSIPQPSSLPNPQTSNISDDSEVNKGPENDAISLMHQKTMVNCPAKGCAADHPLFKSSESLTYNFLTIQKNSEVFDKDGNLILLKLECVFCNLKTVENGGKHGKKKISPEWTIQKSNHGSMSNFSNHFDAKHGSLWFDAKAADSKAHGKLGPSDTGRLNFGQVRTTFNLLLAMY